METFTRQARNVGQTVKDSGTYMLGQTVGFALPQADSLVHYNSADPTHSPTYCYLWWQIPSQMNKVNLCKIFWKPYAFEYGTSTTWLHAAGLSSMTFSCEITLDEGINWTAITGSPFTDGQKNIDILPHIWKIASPGGTLVGIRLAPSASGNYCRLIAGGQMQGNLLSR